MPLISTLVWNLSPDCFSLAAQSNPVQSIAIKLILSGWLLEVSLKGIRTGCRRSYDKRGLRVRKYSVHRQGSSPLVSPLATRGAGEGFRIDYATRGTNWKKPPLHTTSNSWQEGSEKCDPGQVWKAGLDLLAGTKGRQCRKSQGPSGGH